MRVQITASEAPDSTVQVDLVHRDDGKVDLTMTGDEAVANRLFAFLADFVDFGFRPGVCAINGQAV